MRATQRLDLINRIARELQSRYMYNDIDSYLKAHSIQTPFPHSDFSSKFTYVRHYLGDLNDEFGECNDGSNFLRSRDWV